MKNYEKEIINKLLDIYERRGAYRKAANEVRAISITVADTFPEYADAYNHSAYQDINLAIEGLMRRDFISSGSSFESISSGGVNPRNKCVILRRSHFVNS